MLSNYFKIAWRQLLKNKTFSFINTAGLATGLAAFMFIWLYVSHELSYDNYHRQGRQVYRVDFYGKIGDQTVDVAQSSPPMGATAVKQVPGVVSYCRMRDRGTYLVKNGDQHFKEEKVLWADSTFFQFFSIRLLEGDPKTALSGPNKVILSEKTARKYFGAASALGKSLIFDGKQSYEISGVMENVPANTHFNCNMLVSMAGDRSSAAQEWGNINFNTYILLEENADPAAVEAKCNEVIRTNFGPELEQYFGTSWDEFVQAGNLVACSLFPLQKIHLQSDKGGELGANGDADYVYIFSMIGIFILLIACINYMNLATAQSATRAKEVGTRKVVGAERGQLMRQFFAESLLVACLALPIAIALMHLTLPWFNDFADRDIRHADLYRGGRPLILLGAALLTGFFAGLYPAAFLSHFQPIQIIRGLSSRSRGGALLRSGLVIFQFCITIGLLIGALAVSDQLTFMQRKKVGFDRQQVLMIEDAYTLGDQVEAFKNELLQYPGVQSASITSFLPVPSERNKSSFFKGTAPLQENAILLNNWHVDHDYIKTMGMELASGRDFSRSFASDSSAVIINEETAKAFNGENPVGKYICDANDGPESVRLYQIIGVVKNFHYASLRQHIEPLALFFGNNRGYVCLRANGGDMSGLVQKARNHWNQMAPGKPFSYAFMDERFQKMYASEMRIGNIISAFALFTAFISCLGLFGLSAFVAEKRTKEIGIRKVLGASTQSVVRLLSRDFLRLVLTAMCIAVPLAWWAMDKWLSNFAYRTALSWRLFLLTALLAVLGTAITVAGQAIKAAIANPVRSLRSE